MVFDAHIRAFTCFGGAPKRMIYDNLKTVVDAIFVGKERQFNRRFLTLANHYMFEPVACTPESGWEKGQVENQVGNVREWLFMTWSSKPDTPFKQLSLHFQFLPHIDLGSCTPSMSAVDDCYRTWKYSAAHLAELRNGFDNGASGFVPV